MILFASEFGWQKSAERQFELKMRRVEIAGFEKSLSVLMAAPSSGHPETHREGLDAFRRSGGNCIHLHGEGGETHSRTATGEWLRTNSLRDDFFLCSQICHEGWDEAAQQSICRFTADAVHADIDEDLRLIGTVFLDLVYLDDRPDLPFDPVLGALFDEVETGRIRSIGVRNWTPDRIRDSHQYLSDRGGSNIRALITTELALPIASEPLWPGYVPFDEPLRRVVDDLDLTVFAHAGDLTSGQCLFGGENATARMRPHWVDRWDTVRNAKLVERVREMATKYRCSERVIGIAWLLNRPMRVIAIVGLTDLLGPNWSDLERAAQLELSRSDLHLIDEYRQV